jgi:hypothetical protein
VVFRGGGLHSRFPREHTALAAILKSFNTAKLEVEHIRYFVEGRTF